MLNKVNYLQRMKKCYKTQDRSHSGISKDDVIRVT